MFNKLVASDAKRARRGLFGMGSMTVSLIVHGLILVGAVFATVAGPAAAKKAEEEVSFIEIEEKEPEPPKAEEPPPPPPPEAPPEAPPPPKGFQELIPPSEPPPVIPDVDVSQPAVSAEDFTGLGQAGGTSKGVEGGTPQNVAEAAPARDSVFEVAALDYDSRPELSNRNQVGGILSRFYPRMLQDAGIEGQVLVQFVITSDGKVDPNTVKIINTSHEQFGAATKSAVERFRFRPGKYQGKPVPVLIQIPITWKVDR